MSKSKIFFYACCCFIIGVFIASIWAVDFFYAYLILLLAIFCFCLVKYNKLFFVLGLWGFFLFLGIWRCQLAEPTRTPDQIFYYNGQLVEFTGIVNKEPDQREDKVKLEIKAQQLDLNSQKIKVKGKVLVTNSLFPQYQYGDRLKISCQLKEPEPIEDFNYDKYLGRYDIYSLCYNPEIILLEQNKGNIVLAKIYQAKNFFINRLNRALPEPQSSFLTGLLIGAKKAIPADLQTVFNITGTTHIVAVSGYNVTIIAVFLMLLAINLGISRKKAFWLIIGILIIFDIITGLQASIIRATIMGALVLLAGYLGRLSKIRNILILAAVLMLIINPKVLVYDVGFQLSFLATFGLVYLNPVLLQIFKINNLKFKISRIILGDYLLTTLSAIIMTQPLILYQFGKISLIAPLANILILPFIPFAMLLGFIAGIGAIIYLKLGWVLSWPVWLVLSYIIFVLENLARLSWAYWEITKIGVWLMVAMYFVIIGIIYWGRKKYKL